LRTDLQEIALAEDHPSTGSGVAKETAVASVHIA